MERETYEWMLLVEEEEEEMWEEAAEVEPLLEEVI